MLISRRPRDRTKSKFNLFNKISSRNLLSSTVTHEVKKDDKEVSAARDSLDKEKADKDRLDKNRKEKERKEKKEKKERDKKEKKDKKDKDRADKKGKDRDATNPPK